MKNTYVGANKLFALITCAIMGNDGGTIASRKDIIALHLRGKKDNEEDRVSGISTNYCKLTSFPLNTTKHVVGDYMGNLYIKEKIIETMIERKKKPLDHTSNVGTSNVGTSSVGISNVDHIKSLKDLVDVKVEWKEGSIICPVSCSPAMIYAYLRTCGCLLSLKVLFPSMNLAETKSKLSCLSCGSEFHYNYDIVIANPKTSEHREFNEANYNYLTKELKLHHNKSPLKKRKRDKEEEKPAKRKNTATIT